MPDPLKVECPHCGGSLKLKDRSADGKKVRCPKCEEVFRVTLPEDDLDDFDDLEDDFGAEDELLDDEDDAPRKFKGSAKKPVKKKRKSGGAKIPWLIIAIACCAVFTVGGIAFVVANLPAGAVANKIDLTYLPNDANMVVHLKVNEMIASPLIADAMNQPAAQMMLNQQAQQTGVAAKDMVSVTVGSVVEEGSSALKFPMEPRGLNRAAPASAVRTITVMRTSAPIKGEDVANAMKASPLNHGGMTYYKRSAMPFGVQASGDSMYFPEPTVAVMGGEADIKQAIDQGGKQVRRAEFDFINPNMTLLMAFAPKSTPNANATLESPVSQLALQALERSTNKNFRALNFGLRISDRVDLEVIVKCADATGAAEMKTATDALFTDWKAQYEKSKAMLTLMSMNDVIALGDKTVASLKADQSGNLVTAVATVPNDIKAVAERMSKQMPGMMGMGTMGAPPPGVTSSLTPPGQAGATSSFPNPGQIDPNALPQGLPAGVDPSALPAGALPM